MWPAKCFPYLLRLSLRQECNRIGTDTGNKTGPHQAGGRGGSPQPESRPPPAFVQPLS